MTQRPRPDLDSMLAQTDWVRSLARNLVADVATADDVAQAAWLDLLRSPPQRVGNVRGFLASLVRRKAGRARRSAARRHHHEQVAAARSRDAGAPSPAELTERLATHRELVDAVLALDEPYRATIVLRFFEHRDVEQIAVLQHTKPNTVRSRLQRALQQLRERLDRSPGGRERWLPAMALLAEPPAAAAVFGTGSSLGLAALTMKKTAVTVAAVLVGILLTLSPWSPPGTSQPPPHAVGPTAAADAALPADEPALAAGAGSEARSSVDLPPSAPAAAPRPARRLVDIAGRALAGVVMRACSPYAVRWQGGDRGWLSSAERSLFLSAAEEERLRADPAHAASWFAQFAHPDEWRATILGAPLPAREAATTADGGFAFAPGVEAADDAITVADRRFVLVERGRTGGDPWVAGPATRVTGVVTDEGGQPLADARITAHRPGRDEVQLPEDVEVRGDDRGRFLVRAALAGGVLRVRHDGYATLDTRLGHAPEQELRLVLRRQTGAMRREVAGVVVDGGGRPVDGARVWFGRQGVATGIDGRFSLPADDALPHYALTIVAKGCRALQECDFGAAVVAGARTGDLLFVLDQQPLQARGLVLDGDGVPLPDALVGLVDPTLLDVSFTGVEDRVGGFERSVPTGADGTFVLPGLGDRAYRFRAVDPRSGLVVTSPPRRAGDGDIVLRLPAARRQVSGVVRADGGPLADAEVGIAFCTHVTKGGGTMFDAAPPVATDRAGRFVLPVLPPHSAWLGVRVQGALRALVPVETLQRGRIEIDCDGGRWLQLVGSQHPSRRSIQFERADGSLLEARTADDREAWLGSDGTAPPLPLPPDAAAVVVGRGTRGERRLVPTGDRAVHLRVP